MMKFIDDNILKFKFIILSLFPLIFLSCSTTPPKDYKFHPELELFDKLVSEIKRLDGDGLIPRKYRPDSWKSVVQNLRKDLINAKTKNEVGQVFKRLDGSYPNLHAHITLRKDYDLHSKGRINPSIYFYFEMVNEDKISDAMRIKVRTDRFFKNLQPDDHPKDGDQVIQLDGKTPKQWKHELFNHCKSPLLNQCAVEFMDYFSKELLSWDRSRPLSVKLKRGNRYWTIPVEIEPHIRKKRRGKKSSFSTCASEAEKYKGFSLKYEGYHACFYEYEKDRKIGLLRIRSFSYRRTKYPKNYPINNIFGAVERFWKLHWKGNHLKYSKLIIDVLDNGGGNSPEAWYGLFYDKPYQEMYVRFKKIKEIENQEILKHMFYEDPAKFITLKNWNKKKIIENTPLGEFLPPMPQFCADKNKDCNDSLFKPRKHKFKGKVVILTNPWCVSSCVGFVWNMKRLLGENLKFVGIPDSADSSYARIHLDGYIDSKGRTRIISRERKAQTHNDIAENAVFTFALPVSISTDGQGNIISGIPMKMDKFISRPWSYSWSKWEQEVLRTAIEL